MEWVKYAISILSGIAMTIPLIIKLVEYAQKAVKEKNWSNLLKLVMSLMEQAEEKFSDGATRKEWVMAMVKASAGSINYDIDMNAVSDMIENLCNLSKVVNATKENTTTVKAEDSLVDKQTEIVGA